MRLSNGEVLLAGLDSKTGQVPDAQLPPLMSAAWRCSFPTVLCNSTLQSRNKS